MTNTPLTASGLLRVVLALLGSTLFTRAATTFADIHLWAGSPAGPGISEAALVIDFRDGSPALVWGYRWPESASRTGQDMLAAIIGADASLSVDSTFFPSTISWNTRSRSFSDNGTPANYLDDSYWGYWVNNEVFYHPTDFLQNAHVMPPLGSPYESGRWVESSTGAAARPLAIGSWDGWAWGVFGTQPSTPVAVPEPSSALLLGSLLLLTTARRRHVA